jgi:UDP-N-acetylmuramyl pentapeptide synthase
MLLGDYFYNINSNFKKFFFSGISFNSNKIVKDNIFFAIKGNKLNGSNFILHAIKMDQELLLQKIK